MRKQILNQVTQMENTEYAVSVGQWVCEIPHSRKPFAYQSKLDQAEAELRDLQSYHVFNTVEELSLWANNYTGHQYAAVREAVSKAY